MRKRGLNSASHYVLIGPSGKQAGRRDQKKLALQLAALQMTVCGQGGGIVTGLLPKTQRETEQLAELTSRGYTCKKVPVRKTILRSVRQAVMSDQLIAQIAVRFEHEKGHSKHAISAVNREFSLWICEKLVDPKMNEIKKILQKEDDELLNRLSPDWWKKQLNRRKNK
jgi:hypothetical protein